MLLFLPYQVLRILQRMARQLALPLVLEPRLVPPFQPATQRYSCGIIMVNNAVKRSVPKYVLGILAICVFLFYMFRSMDRPELLAKYSGCFRENQNSQAHLARIDGSGKLEVDGIEAIVTLSRDKGDLSFLPDRKIIFSRIRGNKILVDDGFPLLIRLDHSGNKISIPSEDGPQVQLDRTPCQ